MKTRFLATVLAAASALVASSQTIEGTYKGINEYIDATVTITLNNGRATMTTLKERRTNTTSGTYSGNTISFGGAVYSLKREGKGIRVTLRSNTRNTSYYARTADAVIRNSGDGLGNQGSSSNRGRYDDQNSQSDEIYGTFSGYNVVKDMDLTVTIDRDGDARGEQRKRSTGDRRSLYGRFRNGVLVLDQTTYNTGRNKPGIFLQNADDPRDAFQLYTGNGRWNDGNYGSGNDNSDNWGNGNTAPSWLVGTYSGFDVHDRHDVVLTVRNNGSAVADYTGADGFFRRYTGNYRNGRLVMNNATWSLTRGDWGFRATQIGDRDRIIEFKKGAGGGNDDSDLGTVPSWAVGTFKGRMAWARRDVTLTIRNNGNAVADYMFSNGQFERVTGTYRNNRLYLDGTDYRVERYGNGIRVVDTNNSANSATLSQDGDNNGDVGYGSNPPSWLVGRFEGRRWDGANMILRVESDGRAVADYISNSGEIERVTGDYRSGRLNLGRSAFTVTSLSRGVRVQLVGTRDIADLSRK